MFTMMIAVLGLNDDDDDTNDNHGSNNSNSIMSTSG